MLAVLHDETWQVIAGAAIVNTAVMFGYASLPAGLEIPAELVKKSAS